MDTFSNFNKNSQLVRAKKDLLNTDNYEAYIAEHGSERFEGYKEALIQMLSFIHDNVLTIKKRNTIFEQKPLGVKNELINLYNERLAFLKNVVPQDSISNDFQSPQIN